MTASKLKKEEERSGILACTGVVNVSFTER
jgi:hypothetical protein